MKSPAARTIATVALAAVALAVFVFLQRFTAPPSTLSEPVLSGDLAAYHTKYPSKLSKHGPPPPSWQDPTPLDLPNGVEEVTYTSGALQLRAWLSQVPQDGRLHPAVVFCHGGFWFGNEDWDVLQPFIDAGFVVLAPRVRAENGNPGEFEYYYGEVDDVIAAGRYLASLGGVDKKRLFISGHSAGADLATLAAMMDNPFAAAAPIGATLDMRALVKARDDRHRQLIVFDPSDAHEVEGRCAMLFTGSLRIPVHLFHGDTDWGEPLQRQFVSLAQQSKHDASLTVVPGDHGESLPNAIPGIIEMFRFYAPSPTKGAK